MSYLQRMFHESDDEDRRVILKTIRPAPGGSLLDLGCADGVFTQQVAERAGVSEVHGVEFIESWAERARANGVDCVVADLGVRFPYDDASFDVVHSNQVIEHLPRTDVFLREIRRVLKPTGHVVLSTNNLSSWHNIVSLVFGWQPPPCHVSDLVIVGNPGNTYDAQEGEVEGQQHLRIFTGRALAELAEYHGLRLDADLTSGYYPLPVRAARVMTKLDRRHGAFLVQRFVAGEVVERSGPSVTATRAA